MAVKKVPIGIDFENALICALRYCYPRTSYMPSMIIDYTERLLPDLSLRFLTIVFDDIEKVKKTGQLGSSEIDKPMWLEFQGMVKNMIEERDRKKAYEW